jgi:hypothetical protein
MKKMIPIVEDDPLFAQPRLQAMFNPAAAKAGLKKRRSKVMERDVEADGKKRVEAAGGHSAKFKSPGHRSRPDQIELYGIAPMREAMSSLTGQHWSDTELRELLAAGIQFTEYKKPGEKPTAAQEREHERLRALGFRVNVIDQRTEKK